MKLGLAIRYSKNKFAKMKFEYEVKITKLKMRLQQVTPLEVCEQRETNRKYALKSVSDMVVDYGKLCRFGPHCRRMQTFIGLERNSRCSRSIWKNSKQLQIPYHFHRGSPKSLKDRLFKCILKTFEEKNKF